MPGAIVQLNTAAEEASNGGVFRHSALEMWIIIRPVPGSSGDQGHRKHQNPGD